MNRNSEDVNNSFYTGYTFTDEQINRYSAYRNIKKCERIDVRKHHRPPMHTQIANRCLKCERLFYTDTMPCEICPDCAWEI